MKKQKKELTEYQRHTICCALQRYIGVVYGYDDSKYTDSDIEDIAYIDNIINLIRDNKWIIR